MSTVTIQPIPKDAPNNTQLLSVDMTVDSTSPALAASVALLVKIGAPQPTFIDQKIAVPQTGMWYANNLTVFTGVVKGELKQVVNLSALVAAFPYTTFGTLFEAGLITPTASTPPGIVLDHFSNEPPMVYDPHKLPGGSKNPGDYGQPATDASLHTIGPLTVVPAVQGSQGIFGNL